MAKRNDKLVLARKYLEIARAEPDRKTTVHALAGYLSVSRKSLYDWMKSDSRWRDIAGDLKGVGNARKAATSYRAETGESVEADDGARPLRDLTDEALAVKVQAAVRRAEQSASQFASKSRRFTSASDGAIAAYHLQVAVSSLSRMADQLEPLTAEWKRRQAERISVSAESLSVQLQAPLVD